MSEEILQTEKDIEEAKKRLEELESKRSRLQEAQKESEIKNSFREIYEIIEKDPQILVAIPCTDENFEYLNQTKPDSIGNEINDMSLLNEIYDGEAIFYSTISAEDLDDLLDYGGKPEITYSYVEDKLNTDYPQLQTMKLVYFVPGKGIVSRKEYDQAVSYCYLYGDKDGFPLYGYHPKELKMEQLFWTAKYIYQFHVEHSPILLSSREMMDKILES